MFPRSFYDTFIAKYRRFEPTPGPITNVEDENGQGLMLETRDKHSQQPETKRCKTKSKMRVNKGNAAKKWDKDKRKNQ